MEQRRRTGRAAGMDAFREGGSVNSIHGSLGSMPDGWRAALGGPWQQQAAPPLGGSWRAFGRQAVEPWKPPGQEMWRPACAPRAVVRWRRGGAAVHAAGTVVSAGGTERWDGSYLQARCAALRTRNRRPIRRLVAPGVGWLMVDGTREDVDCGIGSVAARWGCGGMWQVPGGGMCVSVCVCVSRVCVRCGMSSVCGCRLRAPGCWMD